MQAHCESWPIIRPRLEAARASGATGYADFAASRPPVSEADAVGRALALAAASGAETYCVHLSTSGAVEHLRLARMHGLAVHGECCPHHLLLDESRYLGERARRLRHEPAAAQRRAPRRALGRRCWTARSRWPRPITPPGPRPSRRPGRASSRPCTAPRATACCCRCWPRRSGRSRASAGSTSRASTAENPARIFRLPGKGAIAPGKRRRSRRAASGRRPARAGRAAVLEGRQRHLPGPAARAAANRPAAGPHARARRRVRRRARRRPLRRRCRVTPAGACETTESIRIGGLMLKFLTKSRDLIAESDALPGRDEAIPVPARHTVLGTPLLPPFPEGIEVVQLGLGCFWGAERLFWQLPGVYTTAVGYAGGYTKNPTLRRGLLRSHRPHRGRPGRLRPEGAAVRGAPAHVLGGSRPDAGHAPGQRHGHAVPLGALLDDGRAARDRSALARRLPGRSDASAAAARSRPSSPRPARSTRPRSTTSSTCRRTRAATAASAARA